MNCDWIDLLVRLHGEPELSVAVVEPPGAVDQALPHPEVEVALNVDWNTLQIHEIRGGRWLGRQWVPRAVPVRGG
uniref:Uncharacterized protein n=1 Tax=Setaria viridis TaxID=4556 RepID=A0A4V6D5E8_SETVI|nr:hypothetical protein SEVIR_6G140800v2 [Setaria viridis]